MKDAPGFGWLLGSTIALMVTMTLLWGYLLARIVIWFAQQW